MCAYFLMLRERNTAAHAAVGMLLMYTFFFVSRILHSLFTVFSPAYASRTFQSLEMGGGIVISKLLCGEGKGLPPFYHWSTGMFV